MKNNDFLKNYIQLQTDIMYQEVIETEAATIPLCNIYDSSFFNYAQVDKLISEEQLEEIESILKQKNRMPALYFENREDLQILKNFLSDKGYQQSWEDSWMFHDGQDIDPTRFDQVKKVANDQDLEVFQTTFDSCYQEKDPQNPYGTLGDYLKTSERAWIDHHKTNRVEYFIVYKKNTPVAVASLTNFANIGYISNVGSLRSVRGEGFGKVASLYCVVKSFQNQNQVTALATEDGDYPNEFYTRIGFETKFSAVGYTKQ